VESYYESANEWEDSDIESLAELEGEELEQNLQSLREEVEQLSAPAPATSVGT
jgi:hypothetical protein